MKKLFALLVVSVFAANIAVAQVNNHKAGYRPHFERLDSDSRSELMKSQKEFWKTMKENEKKWKKHTAMSSRYGKPSWEKARQFFSEHPQEHMAEFVGGKEALTEWIEENITYPISADLTGVEGKVIAAFDVNPDGTIGNVRVEGSADPLLASEVVSKLQEMPRWKPAFQNGRTVKVKYTLPISFTLHS